MGMDVYGKAATSEVGKYFRNNVWWWRPLWDYCLMVAPQLAGKVKHGHSNDGDGLGAVDARALGMALLKEVGEGRTEAFAAERAAELAKLPREPCDLCKGTGVRKNGPRSDPYFFDSEGLRLVAASSALGKSLIEQRGADRYDDGHKIVKDGHPRAGQTGWCNGCNGQGSNRSWDANYPFDVDNVRKFAAFLIDSGGFEIN